MDMKEIIKETIKRRGMSYSDVGKRFDPPCSANNISNTLNKEIPVTPKHVRQFADILSANKKLWLVQAAKDMLQYKTPEVASLFGLTEHFDGLSTAMFKSPQAQYNAKAETPFISYNDLPTTFTTFVLPAPAKYPHSPQKTQVLARQKNNRITAPLTPNHTPEKQKDPLETPAGPV